MNSNVQLSNQQSPGLTRAFTVFAICIIVLACSTYSHAISPEASKDIPHVNSKAKNNFAQYLSAGKNKAFAIAPGGAWAWHSDEMNEDEAEQMALQSCQAYTKQKCILYAVNDHIVFDAKRWPTLWGPYNDNSNARIGTGVGERFHDLTWKDAKGDTIHLSSMKGKLVFLHFWGSWCPPCLREFPSLKKLHTDIKSRFSSDVEMVMLQLREPFEESMAWAEKYEFSDLPLYDSGIEDSEVTSLKLSDGSLIEDRSIARVFPSSYVLDRNGQVLFSHHGPVSDWLEYTPFLEHAVAETRKNVKVKARAAMK